MAVGATGRPVRAARMLRRALGLLEDAGPDVAVPATRARILASLAYFEVEQGRVDEGLGLLTKARELASGVRDPNLDGLLELQHGSILVRLGVVAPAVSHLDQAVRLFADDPEYKCTALLNRSALHLYSGNLRAARPDLVQCMRVAASNGLDMLHAKAMGNLGYLEYLAGDLPAGLRAFDGALRAPALMGSAYRSIVLGGRAEALRAAGLTREAAADLADAIDIFGKARLTHDLAEARLAGADVALLEGRFDVVRRLAGQARRGFLRRGNDTRALIAELLSVQAQLHQRRQLPTVASAAGRLSERLHVAGLSEDGRVAALVAARALLATGDRDEAVRWAGRAGRLRSSDRIGTRLLARLVRAELAGDRRGRARELRGGLDDLHRYQSRFGSLDLQTASVVHGRQLAELGLADALAGGRPAEVFAWAERTRALAARLSPVRPPEDPHAADMLAQLRGVRSTMRAAELAGRPQPELRRRRAALEKQIRQRAWFAAGPAEVDRPVGLAAARAALAEQGGCLVAYLAVRGALHALVVTARSARLVGLGSTADVGAVLERVRADLDALALSLVPAPVREVIRRSLANGLRKLDGGLWRPIAHLTSQGPVVIVPTASLGAVPWTALPGLCGRPLVVVPSASWWVAARARAHDRAGGRPVFAVGPSVPRGESEVRAAATVWPKATVLTGATATSHAVLNAAAGSPLLHVAAHGVHEPDNPLFSAIELADGPLFGYDLPQPSALPTHVVLSACELGLAEVRPGDEALGMTSALLHGGVVSVVAGVARVSDEVANIVMVAHHKALAAGKRPAVALADALGRAEGGEPVPLISFGAGW